MEKPRLTLAIPTFNNVGQLTEALVTLTRNTDFCGRLLVINNGTAGSYEHVQAAVPYEVDWLDAGENLGWSKAINLALTMTDTELFCMMNDDVLFGVDRDFWRKLTAWFDIKHNPENAPLIWHEKIPPWANIAGVGPMSNYAFGYQNFRHHGLPDCFLSPVLIGYCAVYCTELIREGLDESLPGGDDFDLSMRLRAQGYGLVVDRRCFLFHYGSVTGQKLYKDWWDSHEHQDRTRQALIRKHGLAAWYTCLNNAIQAVDGNWARFQNVPAIEEQYQRIQVLPSDVNEHAEVLRTYAEACQHITEFGTDDGTTATIFLAAHPTTLDCYDIVRKPAVDQLAASADGTRFQFHRQNTLEADIEPTDLLFVDDKHTYDHVLAELNRHAAKVRRYILFHDTESLGRQGEDCDPRGIKTAVTEFLRSHPEWRIIEMRTNNNGLMAIARISC